MIKDFYDYEEKYKNTTVQVQIPANITKVQKEIIKNLATMVYRISQCCGFARIDFFISNDQVYINEINTLPGFTDISMFPMLMKHAGLSYSVLIDKIISLAY